MGASHLLLRLVALPLFGSYFSGAICAIPEPIPRGLGRWKLNVSILSDESFGVSVRSFWECWHARKSSFINIQTWWDVGKEKLKGLAVLFCS